MLLLLDFDETLSDRRALMKQFCAVAGGIIANAHGGQPEIWREHCAGMLLALETEYVATFAGSPLNGYCEWLASAGARAAPMLFELAGRELPERADRLAAEIQHRALLKCSCLYPGAANAIRTAAQTYTLCTASANDSAFLDSALTGYGIRPYFAGPLFGPDLLDCAKEGPEYFARLLQKLHVPPERVALIDDDPECCAWITELGASAIQARMPGCVRPEWTGGPILADWVSLEARIGEL